MGGTNDLPDAELRQLAQKIIPPRVTQPFGAYLFLSGDPAAELGRHIERRVFLETFGNTREQLAQEYNPYEAGSIFVCVVDHLRRLPAGVMRVLVPSPAGFKSLNDLEPVWGEPAESMIRRTGLALDRNRTWDLATLAVASEYRGKATAGLVSMGLYQATIMAARSCGIEWMVAILDMPVFRIAHKLSMPFFGFKGVAPLPYLGSAASMPVWFHRTPAEGKRLAASNPEMYAIFVEGTGLESALRPLDLSCTERLGLVA
jgi:hypothetical protein